MTSADHIKKWCGGKESFFFFLPDGQDGRPFDAQYKIIDVSADKEIMIIKLGGDVVFIFEGRWLLREEVCNLIIDGFDRLIYKVNGKVVGCYVGGEFCLSGF